MGGVIVVAIIVILCFIIWKKNQGKNTPAIEKSMESREKPADEKLHKAEDLKNLEDSKKTFEVREEQKYDGSRKKDRGKKRREKRRVEAEEIKEAPATKIEDKKPEAKAEVKKETVNPVGKAEVKAERAPEKTQAKAEKVEKPVEKVDPIKEEAKAKVNEPVKKVEPKVEKVEANPEAKKETVKPVEKAEVKTEKAPEKTEAKLEKIETKIEEDKAKVNEPVKKAEPKVENLEAKAEVKKETVKPVEKAPEKTEAKAEKVEKPVEKVDPIKEEAKAKVNEPVEKVEPKVEKVEEKPETKEKFDKPVEKSQAQKIISTNEKYSGIITSLSENPWDLASEKINIKAEDLKTKKPLDENYSLDDIKKSLTRENLSEFLNMVKTNPTILKRKDNMIYEFTVKNPDEIKKIAERYSLTSSNFEKASSVITVDKENFKLLEVTDILTDGEKRIYFETKF